jgi:hypothetical protein
MSGIAPSWTTRRSARRHTVRATWIAAAENFPAVYAGIAMSDAGTRVGEELHKPLIAAARNVRLAAGIRLAHFGKKVCIFERHNVVGGLNSFYSQGGRKFDVRVYVAVRGFAPLDAAVHCGYYGRVAASPYAGADAAGVVAEQSRHSSHYTVSWYGDGPQSTLLDTPALEAAAAVVGVDWRAQAHPAILRALGELFAGAGRHFIGHWPYSRGLYGVDVLLAWRGGGDEPAACAGGGARGEALQPVVLEVNFAGDLQTILERVPAAAALAAAAAGAAPPAPSPTFADDVLALLFTAATGPEVPVGWARLTADA